MDRLATVTLHTTERQVADLALCQCCYDTYFLPLVSDTDAMRGELLIAPMS